MIQSEAARALRILLRERPLRARQQTVSDPVVRDRIGRVGKRAVGRRGQNIFQLAPRRSQQRNAFEEVDQVLLARSGFQDRRIVEDRGEGRFAPLFETMLTWPPPARPNSALKLLRLIWNSWTASWLTVGRTPLAAMSLLSTPSVVTRLARHFCPAKLSCVVGICRGRLSVKGR